MNAMGGVGDISSHILMLPIDEDKSSVASFTPHLVYLYGVSLAPTEWVELTPDGSSVLKKKINLSVTCSPIIIMTELYHFMA